jgi:Fe-S-cluster containining protein
MPQSLNSSLSSKIKMSMDNNPSPDPQELEQQLTRGAHYLHTAIARQAERLNESEAFLYGLIDALLEKGVVDEAALHAKISDLRAEVRKKGEQFTTGVIVRQDPAQPPVAPDINCAERLPICKAACCRLSFALSVAEIEEGKVRWDLGRPYLIRHDAQGRCVHLQAGSCGCSVYADRPRVCKVYSCRGDQRIWKDFDGMVLNTEWIEENLAGDRLVLAAMELRSEE